MSANEAKHALNLVVLLAKLPKASTLTTQELARRLGLSVSYVENLLKVLRAHEMVGSRRGPMGGHCFCGSVASLSVWDIVSVFYVAPTPLRHSGTREDFTGWLEAQYEQARIEFFKSQHFADLLGEEAPDWENEVCVEREAPHFEYVESHFQNHRDGVGRSHAF
jgi:Rrf2 family protein